MAVYYSQILNKQYKKILTATFSLAGNPLIQEKSILVELKNVVSELPNNEKIYSFHSSNKLINFYFIVTDKFIVSAIADARTTDKIIQKYFDEVIKEYERKYGPNKLNTPHYDFDDTLKQIIDAFNKKYNILVSVEELENTHTTLVENLDSLIKRRENINSLDMLAQRVSMETKQISKKVSDIKFNAQMEQYKIYGGLLVIFLLFIYFFFIR